MFIRGDPWDCCSYHCYQVSRVLQNPFEIRKNTMTFQVKGCRSMIKKIAKVCKVTKYARSKRE